MTKVISRSGLVRLGAVLALVALVFAVAGCAGQDAPAASSAAKPAPAEQPEPQTEPEQPEYSKWIVYVNDDDSYEKDGITYAIALNLTATNPSSDIAGEYTGKATAKTDSTGEYRGQQLNASAIANSSKLEFTLEDPSAEGALAPVTEGELPEYSGSGSIVMKASGSGTYGQAGGPFSNTSGQNLKVSVTGSAVTLEVTIDGHKYTFEGTISGE